MIGSRSKHFSVRIFKFGAYLAARRFAAHRPKAGRPASSWIPLALRWRRRIKPAANVRAVDVKVQPHVSHHQHFHSHFVSQITNRIHLRVPSVAAPLPALTLLRVATDHRWTNTIVDRWSQPSGNVTLALRKTPPSIVSGSFVRRTALEMPPSRSRETRSTPPVFSRPTSGRGQLSPLRPLKARDRQEHDVSTVIATTRSQIRRHDLQLLSRRTTHLIDSTVISQQDSGAKLFKRHRPEKLVWRTLPSSRSSEQGEPEVAAGSSRTSVRPGTHEQNEQDPFVAQSPATQVAKLDPAILDRLTENVITRVEKRIRIERERRGLI